MTIRPPKTTTQQASLVRPADADPHFPGLDRIGERFGAALRGVVAALGCRDTVFASTPVALSDLGTWRAGMEEPSAAVRFNLKPIKGTMLLTVPAGFVMQLVDLFFGGSGEINDKARDFSAAELRFLARMGEHCVPALADAWQSIQPIDPALAGVDSSLAVAAFGKDRDLIAVQAFKAATGPLKGHSLSCVYSVAALRPVSALCDDEKEDQVAADPIWRNRMTDAVMQVRLPLRSVFARPEMPLSQLLTLEVGAVIPICLPTSIPITVAGRHFATASVGESNGRAAIRIEKIQSGGLVYE